MSRLVPAVVVLSVFLCPAAGAAQQHTHAHAAPEKLGTVSFATSCRPETAPLFNRAVALLHSFEFRASIQAFNDVLARDPGCAMAHWGLALSHWNNPMAPGGRTPAQLERGRAAAEQASRLAGSASARERDFIAAVRELFADYENRGQQARVEAYERAMSDVAARHPEDIEARIFYALAVAAAAPLTDKTYERQLKAGAILESLFTERPDHPGIAHYIIHSYDFPPLADRAAAAARLYADIAPSAAHALHMPSHTFTRVGLWEESAATNVRSMDAAREAGSWSEVLHAADYRVYAYLQVRNDSAARDVLDQLPAIAREFDPTAVTGAAPGWAGVFALAAMPARYALERHAWNEAATLDLAAHRSHLGDALTYFARALGAARGGDPGRARVQLDSLGMMHARLTEAGESYWAEQIAIQQLGARAWIALAEDRSDEALALLREAADREDATEKAAVTPGPLAPAREQLADMLMQLDRPAEALAEYRRALEREPNRYWSLRGARQAAAATP